MDRIAIEAKITAYKIELERNIPNRRKDLIANDLHRLSALLVERDKSWKNKIGRKHKDQIDNLKLDHEEEVNNLIRKLKDAQKDAEKLNEEKRLNKLKAQNVFKKLNARLTPDEIKLFSDGLAFIRLFV